MSSRQANSVEERKYGPEFLTIGEEWWKAQYTWLLEAGYRLRPRYHPDWTPSWIASKVFAYLCEDAQKSWVCFPCWNCAVTRPKFLYLNCARLHRRAQFASVTHATHLKTGKLVTLKKINKEKYPEEIPNLTFLTQEALLSDERNHTVRPIDVLDDPVESNIAILAMPLLRHFDDPPFDTIGEAVDFITQLLIVSQFPACTGEHCLTMPLTHRVFNSCTNTA